MVVARQQGPEAEGASAPSAKALYATAGMHIALPFMSWQKLTVLGLVAEDLEAKAAIDLGTKFKTAGALYKRKFDSPGRALDLEVLWKEKGSETDVGAVYKLDSQKKISGK